MLYTKIQPQSFFSSGEKSNSSKILRLSLLPASLEDSIKNEIAIVRTKFSGTYGGLKGG